MSGTSFCRQVCYHWCVVMCFRGCHAKYTGSQPDICHHWVIFVFRTGNLESRVITSVLYDTRRSLIYDYDVWCCDDLCDTVTRDLQLKLKLLFCWPQPQILAVAGENAPFTLKTFAIISGKCCFYYNTEVELLG